MKKLIGGIVAIAAVTTLTSVVIFSQETRPGSNHTVTKDDVERWKKELSNWGRWGKDDQIGTINLITPAKRKQAVALAKERAGIPAGTDVQLITYPRRRSVYEAFSDQFGGSSDGTSLASLWSLLGGRAQARAVASATAPVRLFRRGEPLALMPFAFVR